MRLFRRSTKKIVTLALVVALAVGLHFSGLGQQLFDGIEGVWQGVTDQLEEVERIFTELERRNTPSPSPSSESAPYEKGNLSVHFLDVGNADAILVICDDEAALIDAGENNQGDLVVEYMAMQGVSQIKYAIGTHPHADHIGGLDTVLLNMPVEMLLMPGRTHTSKTYLDVLDAIDHSGVEFIVPQVGDTFVLGQATLTVLSPDREWEDINNNSIVLHLQNGEDSFIFAADAERDAEIVMLDNGIVAEADVLKIGHHGSDTSSSYIWLNAIMPRWCVITCGAENEYGHPHEAVLSRLDDLKKVHGTKVYRSDLNGTIVAHSSGDGDITFTTEYE